MTKPEPGPISHHLRRLGPRRPLPTGIDRGASVMASKIRFFAYAWAGWAGDGSAGSPTLRVGNAIFTPCRVSDGFLLTSRLTACFLGLLVALPPGKNRAHQSRHQPQSPGSVDHLHQLRIKIKYDKTDGSSNKINSHRTRHKRLPVKRSIYV